MNYKVIIRSEGRGWTDEKITEGKVSQVKNGVRLAYSLDGDGCALIANAKRVVQKRSGDQCVAIEFVEGKITKCEIGSGSFRGSYNIFTKSLKFASGKNGFKLSLEYENGSDGELIKLVLTAYVKRDLEKK